MAIFYTDSGSFNDISVTGSILVSGSLIVSGSTQLSGGGITGSFTGSLVGSLTGTSSFATNAGTATTVTTNTVSYTAGAGLSGGGTATLGGASVTIDAVAGAGISLTAPTNDAININTGSTHFISGARSTISVFDTAGANGIDLTYDSGTGVLSGTLVTSTFNVGAGSGLTGGGSANLGATSTVNVGAGLGITVNTDDIAINTSSTHFTDGVKTKLNTDGVVSSSTQFTSLTAPFTGSFTGSFRGSLTATGNPYFDVKAFGAVGNGTTDDYSAFSSSLSAINTAGGGTLYVPKGNYRIGTGLRVTSNTTITGDGRENTIINCNHLTSLPGGAMISGSDINNVVIENLCLSGSGINGVSSAGIRFTLASGINTSHVILRNLFVNDQAGTGISISTPILTTIDNVKVRYTAGDGFSVTNGTSTNFYDCFAVTGLGAGFDLNTMTYCTLTGCASEVYGISYRFTNCSAISLVSCGSEDPIDRSGVNPGYTGIAYRNSETGATSRVALYSCYSRDPRTPAPSGHISGSFQIHNFRAESGSQVLTPLKLFGNSEFFGQVSASAYTSSVINGVGFFGTASFAVSASWAPGGTVGPGTVNSLALFNASSTISSSNVFQSGNNIGVGITNPATTLHIAGNVSASAYTSSIVGAVGFFGTASYALQTAGAGGGVTQVNTGLGLSGGPITSTGTITLDTSSAHFISGSQKVTSSRAVTASYADSFTGFINFPSGLDVTGSLVTTGSIRLTGSLFLSASNTTAANRVLVLNTSTGQVFTTASVGGGGGSGTVGPGTVNSIALFDTANTVSSSILTQLNQSIGINNQSPVAGLDIDAITAQDIIFGTSDFNGYVETNIQNTNAGANASTDVVATSNAGNEIGGFIDMGINSSTYATANNIGGPNDAYLYMTSSNGEMYIGNASTGANSNIKLFAGGLDGDLNTHMFISSSGRIGINVTASLAADLHVNGNISASSYTGSVFGGPLLNIAEMSMLVSGTIAAPGGSTVTLNINNANYFAVSASGTGTVTWVVTNPPPSGRSQTIVIEYVNGGAVTNAWFSGTKWPGAAAPTLTSGVNTDILGFVTDDAGTNWRGVLLQRNSS